MKIGFFVTQVASAAGFEDNVSAHVQLPLYSMQQLIDAGHTVQLITNQFGKERTLPNCLPQGVTVHQVSDGRRRGNGLVMEVGFKKGISPIKFCKQLFQFKNIIEREKYDIVHFFGSNRMAYLAGIMSMIGIRVPLVLTMNFGKLPDSFRSVNKYLWTRISMVITSTEFFKNKCKAQGVNVEVLKHGTVRNLQQGLEGISVNTPHRVLFWRDPSLENGADICLKVYENLAPRFPDVSFDLAIRPHWDPVKGIENLCEKYPNVNVYHFPYEKGISLSKLVAESICILLPFRQLSTHPQFSIMESMMSGVAVVTSAIDSNMELINDGQNGFLVPVEDENAAIEKIEKLLVDREKAAEIGKKAAEDIKAKWNWDHYVMELVKIYVNVTSMPSH